MPSDIRVLLTGFGPFPGARCNPSGPLVQKLCRLRRPSLSGVKLSAHVFATRYAAVDSELPALIASRKPDILLMFGLAARTQHLRVETIARNALASMPDASGVSVTRSAISLGDAPGYRGKAPFIHILTAARAHGFPSALSRDAGRYLCNYAYWRALEAARKPGGPKLVAFIHVPRLRSVGLPVRRKLRASRTMPDLVKSAEAILMVMLAAFRRETPAKAAD